MATIQERFARCLSLLRRLQRGPADRDTLINHVRVDVDSDAYDRAKTPKAQQRTFEADIGFLREVLQVDVPGYDRTSGAYELLGFGAFNPLCLREEELDTLAFLAEAFQPGAPNSDEVQQLLRRLEELMTPNQREALVDRRQRLQMDLRRKDTDVIHPRVEEALQHALRSRRLLRFAYLSPGQADGVPRVHTVEPWKRYFDTARGHYYLDAYRREVAGPHGVWRQGQWQAYRLGRIQADEHLRVLPDKRPPTPPKRPSYRLAYVLAPEIARLGQVTRHFEDMRVVETDEAGWVRIVATTNDLFRACRLLLTYGPNCRVVGGYEARREMEALVRGMAEVYGQEKS